MICTIVTNYIDISHKHGKMLINLFFFVYLNLSFNQIFDGILFSNFRTRIIFIFKSILIGEFSYKQRSFSILLLKRLNW